MDSSETPGNSGWMLATTMVSVRPALSMPFRSEPSSKMLITLSGCSTRGIGGGAVSVNVCVVDFVRVTTTGVGDGVPGRNVSGVGTPLGTVVGYGVGVEANVAVGSGAVGVSAGVLVGVPVGGEVAVGGGVRLGVSCGVRVAVREGVLGGNVTGVDVRFTPDKLGPVARHEQVATATNANTTTNASLSSNRTLDCFTLCCMHQPGEVTPPCPRTAATGEWSSIAKQRCPTLYHRCPSRLAVFLCFRHREIRARRSTASCSWLARARSPVARATDPDIWPDLGPGIPADDGCDHRGSTGDPVWTHSGSGHVSSGPRPAHSGVIGFPEHGPGLRTSPQLPAVGDGVGVAAGSSVGVEVGTGVELGIAVGVSVGAGAVVAVDDGADTGVHVDVGAGIDVGVGVDVAVGPGVSGVGEGV